MELLATILHPIVMIMRYLLDAYHVIFGSWGMSIVVLSVSASLLLLPLQRFGRRIEKNTELRISSVNAEVGKLDESLKGEQRFNKIEEIYQSHAYHPIHQVWGGASILVILPVLISAVILFGQHPLLVGSSFLFVADLSEPDNLFHGLNILPGIMFLVTMLDAFSRFSDNRTGLYRYLILSIVLIFLVYNLPASLLIFWIGNNLMSLVIFRVEAYFSTKSSKLNERLQNSR